MKERKIFTENYIAVICNTVLFGTLIMLFQSPTIQIASFLLMCIITLAIERFDFLNPICWYLSVFTVYSTGYPILFVFGLDTSRGYSCEPMRWCWIAYFVFVLSFNITNRKKIEEKNRISMEWNDKRFFYYFLFLTGLYISLCAIYILEKGYQSKREIYLSGNVWVRLAFVLIYTLHTIYVFVINANDGTANEKHNKFIALFVGAVSILLAMFSGERDLLLRFIIITIFTVYLNGKIDTRRVMLLSAIAVILYPLTRTFKYFFLNNQISVAPMEEKTIFHYVAKRLLSGEFESASRNLQIIANDKAHALGQLCGISYLSDIMRVFGYAPASSLKWFNDCYYSESTVGHGFTIVGEGLVNFGVAGIVVSFFIIGIMQRYMYNRKNLNEYYQTIYIVSIPIFMYSIRADFANILSPLFRQIILPLLLADILTKRKKILQVLRRKK